MYDNTFFVMGSAASISTKVVVCKKIKALQIIQNRISQYNTALELHHDIIFRPVVVDSVTVYFLIKNTCWLAVVCSTISHATPANLLYLRQPLSWLDMLLNELGR